MIRDNGHDFFRSKRLIANVTDNLPPEVFEHGAVHADPPCVGRIMRFRRVSGGETATALREVSSANIHWDAPEKTCIQPPRVFAIGQAHHGPQVHPVPWHGIFPLSRLIICLVCSSSPSLLASGHGTWRTDQFTSPFCMQPAAVPATPSSFPLATPHASCKPRAGFAT